MGEDAAAAARRIVEEVLAQREAPSQDASGAAPAPGTGPDPVAAAEPPRDTATQGVESASPGPAETPGSSRPERSAGRTELVSEAERIARRIVDEVLADEAEVTVRGVPRDGLPVEGERTAKIEVDPALGETTQRVPGGSGATASAESSNRLGVETSEGPSAGSETRAATATPAPGPRPAQEAAQDSASAEDIVRRIVADVQAEGQPEQSGDPASAIPYDEGRTRVVPRTGEKREAPSESTNGPVALADDPEPAPGRPLVGWAPPPEPPPYAPVPEDSAPRTLRWLLASLLGAVALAVLFPLAVAALRALVSLG